MIKSFERKPAGSKRTRNVGIYFFTRFISISFCSFSTPNSTRRFVAQTTLRARDPTKYTTCDARCPQVTASQLYGADETTAKELRTFSNGKLKTECFDGEHYPPYLSSASRVHMVYPSSTEQKDVQSSQWVNHTSVRQRVG